MKRVENLNISNARLLFRNFSGEQTQYNPKGNRNFNVVIDDPAFAQSLKDEGWLIKSRTLNDDSTQNYLQVKVSYANVPPHVYLITKVGDKRKKVELTEETIGSLDHAEIVECDLCVSPYFWEINGKSGIKAYLKTMYVTIESDPFAEKYNDISDFEPIDDNCPF